MANIFPSLIKTINPQSKKLKKPNKRFMNQTI